MQSMYKVTIVKYPEGQICIRVVLDETCRERAGCGKSEYLLFLFRSELMDLFVAGRDQSAADQPNNLAEGHPPL